MSESTPTVRETGMQPAVSAIETTFESISRHFESIIKGNHRSRAWSQDGRKMLFALDDVLQHPNADQDDDATSVSLLQVTDYAADRGPLDGIMELVGYGSRQDPDSIKNALSHLRDIIGTRQSSEPTEQKTIKNAHLGLQALDWLSKPQHRETPSKDLKWYLQQKDLRATSVSDYAFTALTVVITAAALFRGDPSNFKNVFAISSVSEATRYLTHDSTSFGVLRSTASYVRGSLEKARQLYEALPQGHPIELATMTGTVGARNAQPEQG